MGYLCFALLCLTLSVRFVSFRFVLFEMHACMYICTPFFLALAACWDDGMGWDVGYWTAHGGIY